MTTVSDLINDTKRHLYGTYRAEMNQLASTAASGDTTLSFTYDLQGLTRGSYVSLEDEVVYVWSVNSSAKTAVVQRGQMGTTAATHAAGVMVEVNPRFPTFSIRDAVRDEIRSWPATLFSVPTPVTISTSAYVRAYDLAGIGPFLYVIDVRISPAPGALQNSGTWPRVTGWQVMRNADLTAFPSGFALFIPATYQTGRTLRVQYARPFDVSVFTDSTDVIATVGLSDTMVDIPSIGAAARLVTSREIKRTFTEGQGEARRAEEVQAGAATNVGRNLMALRDKRVAEEGVRLMALYPRHQVV